MKKIIRIIVLLLIILVPFTVFAKEKKIEYKDKIIDITNVEDDGKIHFYLFYSKTCPHCKSERKFINDNLKDLFKGKVAFYEYEISKNEDLYKKVTKAYDYDDGYVPFTAIGDKYYVGFSDTLKSMFINKIDSYIEGKSKTTTFKLPFIGEVSAFAISIPTLGVILGLLDGFNPCALWILLFLINIMIGMKDRKKMVILGLAFLLSSGTVYFLAMLGISFVLDITMIDWIQRIIGIIAIIAGFLQLKKWHMTRKEVGCSVVDDKKRKNIFTKVNKIMKEKNFIIALIGIIILAVSVNMVELACSIGFPAIYSEILAINNIHGVFRILYLLLYCFCYMFDDFVIFILSVATLSIRVVSNKYNKYVTIVSAIIMLLIGFLLIFKPSWIMLNF